eukprot:768457-Hanusia_phi.AAC.5
MVEEGHVECEAPSAPLLLLLVLLVLSHHQLDLLHSLIQQQVRGDLERALLSVAQPLFPRRAHLSHTDLHHLTVLHKRLSTTRGI